MLCEIGEKEIKQCEKLAKALAEAGKNGKCSSHEQLVGRINWIGGGMAVLLLTLAGVLTSNIMMMDKLGDIKANVAVNRAVNLEVSGGIDTLTEKMDAHSGIDAHPVMKERADEFERRLDEMEEDR